MTQGPETLNERPVEMLTEPFDPVSCFSSRDRSRAQVGEPSEPGRYLQVQGPDQALLIPLAGASMHLGRGLAADVRLDHNSVSRRHAIIVPRPSGARILDDRSLNGTYVNGRRVDHADLANGDLITLGAFQLRYIDV